MKNIIQDIFYLNTKINKQAFLNKIIVFLLCFAIGGFLGNKATCLPKNFIGEYVNSEVEVKGTILPETVEEKDSILTLTLNMYKIKKDGKWEKSAGKLKITIVEIPKDVMGKYYGRLTIKGEIKPIISFLNPGSFDAEIDARRKLIGGRMVVKYKDLIWEETERELTYRFVEWNRRLKMDLHSALLGESSSIVISMLLGNKKEVSSETKRLFSDAGISHIMSVSGSHLAIVMSYVLLLLKELSIKKGGRLVLFSLIGIIYAGICGFHASILRALVMSIALFFSKTEDLKWKSENILCLSALGLLLYKPIWIFDTGFQLSFLATSGIVLIRPVIKPWVRYYVPKVLADVISISLAVQIAIVPLLIRDFHKVSLCSLISNIVAMPILELSIAISIFGLIIGKVFGPLGAICFYITHSLLSLAIWVLKNIVNLPLANLVVAHIPKWTIFVYYLGILSFFRLQPFTKASTQMCEVFSRLCFYIIILRQIVLFFLPQPFTVYFLDVGQGDCALIRTPDKQNILVDTGGLPNNFEIGEKVVVPFLQYYGITKLDLVAISHGHFDHIGGAEKIAEYIDIEKVLLPNEKGGELTKRFLEKLDTRTEIRKLEGNEKFFLGGCTIDVIAAPEEKEGINLNENSTILKVIFGDNSILFTGDATGKEELAYCHKGVKADVLKISHHASKHSSEKIFLDEVNPKIATISCGRNNYFKHPHKDVLDKLNEKMIKVVRTDKMGTIKIELKNGKGKCFGYKYDKESF